MPVGCSKPALVIVETRPVRLRHISVCVRTAALPLKLLADAWVLIVCGTVLALYWFG